MFLLSVHSFMTILYYLSWLYYNWLVSLSRSVFLSLSLLHPIKFSTTFIFVSRIDPRDTYILFGSRDCTRALSRDENLSTGPKMPADFFFFFFSHLKFRISINLPSFLLVNRAKKRTIDERRDESRVRLNGFERDRVDTNPPPLVLLALDAETQPPRGFSSRRPFISRDRLLSTHQYLSIIRA